MACYRKYFIAIFLLLSCCSTGLQAQQLKVAVASNFYHSLVELVAPTEFAKQVKLSSGSTGLLYAQIRQGAPFDLFLSADSVRPKLLVEQGLAYQAKTYAIGELVLWPAASEPKKLLQTFQGKLAIANPKLAPYGKAALQVLITLELVQAYQTRLVKGNNVSQAFQFVDSGNAPLALLAKSQLLQAEQKFATNKSYDNFQAIPKHWYQPIKQQMVILKQTKQLALAQKFSAWLLSDKVQQELATFGYRRQD